MIHLPEKFVQTVKGVHRQQGERWLKNFDELIAYCEEKWSLEVLNPFPLSYNFVAPAVFKNGTEAVLKLCVPGDGVRTEIAALRLYNGKGIARLIDADEEKGILILERLQPGDTLKSVKSDEEATLIAARVMKNMRTRAPHRSLFPSTVQWAAGLERLRRRFNGGTGPLPDRLVRKAEAFYAKLNSTVNNPQLLHGDLHHENILSAEREPWLAIDPKGLIGEAEYEVISFLMNNLPEEQPEATIKRRVDLFAEELQLRKERVLAWAFCHAILAAWWCIEDNGDCADSSIRLAIVFETLLNETD